MNQTARELLGITKNSLQRREAGRSEKHAKENAHSGEQGRCPAHTWTPPSPRLSEARESVDLQLQAAQNSLPYPGGSRRVWSIGFSALVVSRAMGTNQTVAAVNHRPDHADNIQKKNKKKLRRVLQCHKHPPF